MSARSRRIEFAPEREFELQPRFERGLLQEKFNDLKEGLLGEHLAESPAGDLNWRFEQAANEAAGLAWTTEYPLLVFPALFAEFTAREKGRADRQECIRARSEMLITVV